MDAEQRPRPPGAVETLGNFLEFECLVCESQTIDTCHEVLRELRHAFQQAIGESIDRS